MMFRAVVFTFMPTAIELVLVCTLLAQRFKPAVALAVVATFVAYVGWTTVMTKVDLLTQHLYSDSNTSPNMSAHATVTDQQS